MTSPAPLNLPSKGLHGVGRGRLILAKPAGISNGKIWQWGIQNRYDREHSFTVLSLFLSKIDSFVALIDAMENKVELVILSSLKCIRRAVFFYGERCRVISGWHGLDGFFGIRSPTIHNIVMICRAWNRNRVVQCDNFGWYRLETIALRFAISRCCMATVQ